VTAAIRRINKPTARPVLHVIQPTLVVRGSTGAPR
jgi:DNA-binding LacI/PurR family transcriptional regulator